MIKLLAFDLDGTITQHKTPIEPKNKAVLERLSEKYKTVIVSAGQCRRIFEQLDRFPTDIIGNYGMQYAEYDPTTKDIIELRNDFFVIDRESVERRIDQAREKFGFTEYIGKGLEIYPSGCVAFPILGTDARLKDKLAFDPDRTKRRKILSEMRSLFDDYNLFIAGSSSFDLSPISYDKYNALDLYCKEKNISHDEVVFVGDDYGYGGNDESVYRSDFGFICIDDYLKLDQIIKHLI